MRIVHTARPLLIRLSREVGYDNDLVRLSAERAFEETRVVFVVYRLLRDQPEFSPANSAPTIQTHQRVSQPNVTYPT
jgi:hypothetical protein